MNYTFDKEREIRDMEIAGPNENEFIRNERIFYNSLI